ncbi:iron-containing redox enzyme family protein [Phenylobacterium sp.]|uniref:iron-containing redox enzyme family protein n=1 Tax=Phenylobacterium sp. TaxID=1871053 RepID=UPI00286A3F94|nr:iron-containing redox enzyme family protein [Phenylobacterium sp.]
MSVDPRTLADLAVRLADSAGVAPVAAFDGRIDNVGDDPSLRTYVKHQVLLRAYQARYVVLPDEVPAGGVLEPMGRHYDAGRLGALAALRPGLEAELIAPLAPEPTGEVGPYVAAMLTEIRDAPENGFTAWLGGAGHRDDHYRNFLVQSSPDLLAEASASALGVVGDFGEPQSALFRILIDEFGYGSHPRKHSVLFRATLKSFGLDDAYNGYWPWFDTEALALHNTIHWLFQNPGNIFRQVGFLLYAETAYQRSTKAHHRYLRQHHPGADARYFAEHAHIDLHHTRMVIDEAVTPLVARFGPQVGAEIIAGADLTKAAFARAGAHLLGVSQAFAAAPSARWGVAGAARAELGRPVTPSSDLGGAPVQVGVLGVLEDGRDLAAFPPAAIGRLTP